MQFLVPVESTFLVLFLLCMAPLVTAYGKIFFLTFCFCSTIILPLFDAVFKLRSVFFILFLSCLALLVAAQDLVHFFTFCFSYDFTSTLFDLVLYQIYSFSQKANCSWILINNRCAVIFVYIFLFCLKSAQGYLYACINDTYRPCQQW